jgi:hypothetical protein
LFLLCCLFCFTEKGGEGASGKGPGMQAGHFSGRIAGVEMRRILVMLQAVGIISCMSGVGAFGGPMLDVSGQQDEMVSYVQAGELFEIAAVARILRPDVPDGLSVFGGAYPWVEGDADAELCVPISTRHCDGFVSEESLIAMN